MPSDRRLAAIMFTDIVGYTALMAESEERGLRARQRHRNLVRPLVTEYHGESIEARGDESLSVFPTALDAVNCALAIENCLRDDPELRLHIGIHLGDLVVHDGEVSGDGVNIASRLCALSEGGGLCVSGEVHRSIRNQPGIETTPLGEQTLKNVPEPVAVHAVSGAAGPPRAAAEHLKRFSPTASRWVVLAVAALLVAALLAWRLYEPSPAGAPLTSIAVLPFDDMSPGGDQGWLADGMAEELIDALTRIEELRVIARTSAFAHRGADIASIGDALRVGAVVEGSLRRSGDQLLVTAQLIRVADQSHLWSRSYERELDDVFAIQREIAREVAEAVRMELGVAETVSYMIESRYTTPDVRAWELVRKANEQHLDLAEAGFRAQIELCQRALEIDPEYAQAHALLGWGYYWLFFFAHDSRDETYAQARAAAERALELEPTNVAAHNLLGQLSFRELDWAGAEARYLQALKVAPSQGVLRDGYGLVLLYTGRVEEAAPHLQRAVDLDPELPGFLRSLADLSLVERDYPAAVRRYERALRWPGANETLAYVHHLSGDDERAFEALLPSAPSAEAGARWRTAFDEGGYLGVVRALVEERIAESGRPCTSGPDLASYSLAIIGEADRMFECLEEGLRLKRPAHMIKVHPAFDPYRDDPRFSALLRRMNLVD
ncbi:MAG: adenylate/guanylate cyclase domain-containing protein [Planctomycetota bacterium]|jgi:TolB-like protein/Flp pilus assembly protein TadD